MYIESRKEKTYNSIYEEPIFFYFDFCYFRLNRNFCNIEFSFGTYYNYVCKHMPGHAINGNCSSYPLTLGEKYCFVYIMFVQGNIFV